MTAVVQSLSPTELGTAENPVEMTPELIRGGAHVAGACSIQKFCEVGSLSHTHEDARGFLAWISGNQHATPNFWFQDQAVQTWAYYEPYDHYQDTYGMDADLVSYHSGHGGMDANGVFYVPMGGRWQGDCTARSDRMQLGNQYCRYLFWSTCTSLRVNDGHSPIRTWYQANQGMRMIFGFETISWDDPGYGELFGQYWNSGQSLSWSWLLASWAVAHDQSPSVTACGASPEEAQNRLDHERMFQWDQSSKAYWAWRWLTPSGQMRELNMQVPAGPALARLAPIGSQSIRRIAERFGFDASQATMSGAGASIIDGQRRLTASVSGIITAHLATPSRETTPIDLQAALSAANRALHDFGLDADGPLMVDRVAEVCDASASANKPDAIDGPHRRGYLVQYRQIVNGMPVITPNAGAVRILVDNTGTICSIVSTTRTVEGLRSEPFGAPAVTPPPSPREAGPSDMPEATGIPGSPGMASSPEGSPNGHRSINFEQKLSMAVSDRLRALAIGGDVPVSSSVVPNSTEIGFDFQGNQGVLVAQRGIEFDFGQGFRKRYWVKVPIFG